MTNKISRSKMSALATAAALLGLLMAGCSTTSPTAPVETAALKKVELNFSLDQCEEINDGLYRCPPKDKAICDPYYDGQLNCLRIGEKGNVFVEKAFED